jgi:phospholipid-binding lipoprotein MlaA
MKPTSPWILALALTGCAANGDPRDPLEPMNRAIHSFNEGFDRYLLQTRGEGYDTVMPTFAQTGVRNFFSNLDDVTVVANDILQFKLEQGAGISCGSPSIPPSACSACWIWRPRWA